MTEYVLEILDGDSAGRIIELSDEPILIGRRSSCTIVLQDEKVSGRHAQVTREDDQFLLKDLGSTNGTLLDGRPVTEVALTPNDVLQLGRIRVAFKAKGAPTPGGDMSVRKVDAATLAKTRKRGAGILALLVVVVALAGFAFWYQRQDFSEGTLKVRQRKPMVVAGNRLPQGVANIDDATEEGGWISVAGAELDRGRGHSGRAALQMSYATPGDAAGQKARHFGVARIQNPVNITGARSLKFGAWLQTEGRATAALRLRFSSSVKGDDLVITAGTKPAAYEDYTEVQADLGVPDGMDRVQVEVLGLLPGEGAIVRGDDFWLLWPGSAKPLKHRTKNGRSLTGSGTGVAMRFAQEEILLRVVPVTTDAALREVDAAGLLGLSDAGLDLNVTGTKKGFELQVVGAGAAGVRLDFRAEVGAAGVLARRGKAPFQAHPDSFQADEVDEVLLGFDNSRVLLVLPEPGPARGETKDGTYRLTLPGASSVFLVTTFEDDARLARDGLAKARQMRRQGHYEQALDHLDQVLHQCPHDNRENSRAATLRAELRDEQNRWLDRLQVGLDDARFFGTQGGFRRVHDELVRLQDKFGKRHLTQPQRFQKLQQDVEAALTRLGQERARTERADLEVLAEVFEGKPQLQDLVRGYIRDHLPPPPAAKDSNGNGNRKEDG